MTTRELIRGILAVTLVGAAYLAAYATLWWLNAPPRYWLYTGFMLGSGMHIFKPDIERWVGL